MKLLKYGLKVVPLFFVILVGPFLTGQETGYKVNIYGFIRTEMLYDNTEIAGGDWLLFIPNSGYEMQRQVFTMTSRHSRLGMNISNSDPGNMKITGLIEFDFAGGFPNSSTAARQPLFRLRLAWIEIVKQDLSLRFGQDWALIASPFPATTSFVVGAGTGNLWMRFPQLSAAYDAGIIKIAGSLNRPMAGNIKYNSYKEGDFDPIGDGEITGRPWYMGRIWIRLPFAVMSTSGHYGLENVKDLSGREQQIKSWSMNADLEAFAGSFKITGRVFKGENLDSFFGGIFKGVVSDSGSVKSLPSQGGWIQGSYSVAAHLELTGGIGRDDPDNDLLPVGTRAKNTWKYANIKYQFNPALSVIFEVESLTTAYKNDRELSGVRCQLVAYLKF